MARAVENRRRSAVCRRHLRIYEIPVSSYGRSYAEGKKITWRDGLTAVRVLVRARSGERVPLPAPHAEPVGVRLGEARDALVHVD